MAKQFRKCLTCGTKYSFCPDCSGSDRLAPTWKSEFCCEDCTTIWTTATQYNMNILSKKEAKEIISAIALKPMDNYASCVQRDLKVILAEEPKAKRVKKTASPTLDEVLDSSNLTVKVDAEIKEINDDTVVVDVKPVFGNKSKTKSHEVVIERKKEKE